jgi:hypothetical protein
MVKSPGGQRESERGIVPVTGMHDKAPVGKGSHFDRASEEGKRQGMAGSARSNSPGRSMSVSMINSPSGGTTDTNQTGRSPANAQDYSDIRNPSIALTRESAGPVGISRASA